MSRVLHLMDGILILGICLFTVVFVMLPKTGLYPLHVLSGSMEPEIRKGDLVIVRSCDAGDIKTGDVISYETGNGQLVLHRVVRKTETGFITKGDANGREDVISASPRSLQGKLVLVIPKGGLWLEKLQSGKMALFLCLYGAGKSLSYVSRKKRHRFSR